MEGPPDQDQGRSRWTPPADSDLIGIPLVLGLALAMLAIIASFIFLDWVGFVVLAVVLIAALAISYRVITESESD
jgi:hypothetical protein